MEPLVVKHPKLVAGEDGVVEGAKSLGRMHGTEIGANFNPAASPFRKNVGFRTMAARLPLCTWTSYMTRVRFAFGMPL